MHILIVGSNGVGKSTLIRRSLENVSLPVNGFLTKKEAPTRVGGDEPVYIHSVSGERSYKQDNLVGTCTDHHSTRFPEAFERAVHYLRGIPAGSIVLMDELGVMESDAHGFCAAVLKCLDGDSLVIAAVRDKKSPFLDAVRAHPRARCFFINPENRDALFLEVKAFLDAIINASDHPRNDINAPGRRMDHLG
jgi:nucleoside-triphosphatase